jgi:hypothetical protein
MAYRLTDTYGLVLALIVLDYIVVSTLLASSWGTVLAVFLLSITLWITLRVSRSRRIWQLLAVAYLALSTLSALISELTPGADTITQYVTVLAGVLLVVVPFAILCHIASQPVVTTETVLGGVCVYLLIGFAFAFIYLGIALFSPSPFFEGREPSTVNNSLFFSYTTLTTVGYGNLVPAASIGQTFAMLEVLAGQIYLVLIVARLVSLWGQVRPQPPRTDRRQHLDTFTPDSTESSGRSA